MCGDGVLDPGEACDDGNETDGDGCSAACVDERCGDGVVNDAGAEACDDGNAEDGDGCSSVCAPEPGFDCDGEPSACAATCGDGLVAGSEACDDANTTDGDGCSATCSEKPGFACAEEPSVCSELCGDGVVTAGEACDDGADNSDAVADACRTDCTLARCGDLVIDAGEECDDANPTEGARDGAASQSSSFTGRCNLRGSP